MNSANNTDPMANSAHQTLSSLLLQAPPPPPMPIDSLASSSILLPPHPPASSALLRGNIKSASSPVSGGGSFGRVPSSVAPGQTPPPLTGTCDACGKLATQQHLNYGANVCFSCRAFFRRAHNTDAAAPQFVCKTGGQCAITPKNRRRCQKCR